VFSVNSVAKLLSGKNLLATEGTENTERIPIRQTRTTKKAIKQIDHKRPGMHLNAINLSILTSVPSVNSVANLFTAPAAI